MTLFTEYIPGMFCWADYVAYDMEEAAAFYASLFGWRTEGVSGGEGMPGYKMCFLGDKVVCGIGEHPNELREKGMPPVWNSYIATEDVDAWCKKAEALGGSVLEPAFDIGEQGRMAVVTGPEGAAVGLWQAGTHIGAAIANVPGATNWNELATNKHDASVAFLKELCGWTSETADHNVTRYTSMKLPSGRMAAGVLEMNEEWEGIPPHWSVYFTVEDCDASVKRAEELGAKAMVPPTDIPPVGRFSVLQDPQGGMFTLIRKDVIEE